MYTSLSRCPAAPGSLFDRLNIGLSPRIIIHHDHKHSANQHDDDNDNDNDNDDDDNDNDDCLGRTLRHPR